MKAAIIGAGVMGHFHINSYLELPDVEVKGVFDKNKSSRDRFAREYDIEAYGSIDELLENDDIDIVNICSPTHTHKDFFIKSIQADKHVFCEKPLARNLNEAKEILNTVRKSKNKASVGHTLRLFQEYETIKKAIDDGEIGDPAVIRTSRGGALPLGSEDWYADFEKSGGVVFDLIIHDFDFLRYCFGDVGRVFAKGLVNKSVKGKDYALVTLRFKNGVIAHCEGHWAYPGDFYMELEAAGSKGVLHYDSRKSRPLILLQSRAKEEMKTVEVPENPLVESPYMRQLRRFIEAIVNDTEPFVTVEEAYEALRISDAAYESIVTGKVIEL